jgi:acyl-CoA reductase-like NAD-dependent aldehyde dehydrogenase
MRKYLNYIGGEWVPAAAGAVFETRNPADARELTAQYASSGKIDTGAAIEVARKAFPAWSRLTAVARGRFLSKASQVLESRKQEVAEFLTREEGKTIVESQGEVLRPTICLTTCYTPSGSPWESSPSSLLGISPSRFPPGNSPPPWWSGIPWS